MENRSLQYYLDKRATGRISQEEWAVLRQLLQQEEHRQYLNDYLLRQIEEAGKEEISYPEVTEEVLASVLEAIGKEERPVRRVHFLRSSFFRYAAAVILIVGLGTAAYVLLNRETPVKDMPTVVVPGENKATLTLGDGSTIVLDSAANGKLANQGGVQVIKLANGEISYDTRGASGKQVMWNTITTPRGGQCQITLPDGTKVWLNAASSIRFPTAFMGKSREIKMEGEIYFEVAKDGQKPFLVNVDGQSTVEVLGTSFNINAYKDEKVVKTTLVEGSVRVNKDPEQHVMLKPGYQAIIDQDLQVQQADLEQTLAWKNGFFIFEKSNVSAVMRQLERWYDIQVRYEGKGSNITFQGKMHRSTSLPDVLRLLQTAGIKCRLEGRTLTVL